MNFACWFRVWSETIWVENLIFHAVKNWSSWDMSNLVWANVELFFDVLSSYPEQLCWSFYLIPRHSIGPYTSVGNCIHMHMHGRSSRGCHRECDLQNSNLQYCEHHCAFWLNGGLELTDYGVERWLSCASQVYIGLVFDTEFLLVVSVLLYHHSHLYLIHSGSSCSDPCCGDGSKPVSLAVLGRCFVHNGRLRRVETGPGEFAVPHDGGRISRFGNGVGDWASRWVCWDCRAYFQPPLQSTWQLHSLWRSERIQCPKRKTPAKR